MADISGKLSIKKGLKPAQGAYRFMVTIRFPRPSTPTARLEIFDGIKRLGSFSIKDQRDHAYVLDFRSGLAKAELTERLKELAASPAGFEYAIKEDGKD